MSCILMLAGGYVLLAVTAACDAPQCLRVPINVERVLSPDEIPSGEWQRVGDHPLLVCLTQPSKE